ncbi:MAG: hypothetical protein LC799_15855 [Actinobacteria bacterium]|nr:hypothetical protein [Actinomycetota bacterium]
MTSPATAAPHLQDQSSPTNLNCDLHPSSGGLSLGTRIHERFAAEGGVNLELPPRSETPRAAVFEA